MKDFRREKELNEENNSIIKRKRKKLCKLSNESTDYLFLKFKLELIK